MEILILDPQRLGRGRFGRRGQVDEEPVAGGLVPPLARHSPTLLWQTKSHSNVCIDDVTGTPLLTTISTSDPTLMTQNKAIPFFISYFKRGGSTFDRTVENILLLKFSYELLIENESLKENFIPTESVVVPRSTNFVDRAGVGSGLHQGPLPNVVSPSRSKPTR